MWASGIESLCGSGEVFLNCSADNGPDTWRWVEDGDDLNTVKHQKQPLNSYYGINLTAGAWELPEAMEDDSIGTKRLHFQIPAALQNWEHFFLLFLTRALVLPCLGPISSPKFPIILSLLEVA